MYDRLEIFFNNPRRTVLNMNLTDKLIRSQLELTKPFADGSSIDLIRSVQDRLGKAMFMNNRRNVAVNEVVDATPKGALMIPRDELRGGIILYLHGGGYTCGTLDYAKGFASVLASKCGMRVYTTEYRLAPEHPYPAALDDAEASYLYLIENGYAPDKIILAGESAGGGLAYALCLRLRDKGIALPAGIIAISPWCDLTLSGASHVDNRDRDPSLSRERVLLFADCYVGAYTAEDTKKSNKGSKGSRKEIGDINLKKNPYVSPVFADLTGMPPSLIFVGGDEILLSDSLDMTARLEEYGCQATLIKKEKMWHTYILYSLKSNAKDFDKMNEFVKKCLPKDNERKLKWMHLDNAAKIYPAAKTYRWNNIYRLSATLTEDVDRECLQSALDVTVRRFPSIAVRLKRGVFWYYLEEIARAPEVQDEKSYPLVRMPFDDIRHCAFRIIVYKKRIAAEFFHALTDGNGGLTFLKTLIAEYLTQKYGVHIPNTDGVLDRLEEPKPEELEDCYPKHKAIVGKSRNESDSYRIHGEPEADGFCHATTFMIKSRELLDLAHKNKVTLTAALAAAFLKAAINLQAEDVKKPKHYKKVKILIPVDLRKIYNRRTLRNFSLYTTPGVDPKLGEYTYEELCQIVYHRMCLDISEKNMSARIYTNVKDEENMLLKLTPLFLKNLVMKMVYLMAGERKSLFSMSNLGLIKLPSPMDEYVDRFDVILSPQLTAPYNVGVISYKDDLNLTITRNIKEARLEMAIYRVLRECGIHVKVESNSR